MFSAPPDPPAGRRWQRVPLSLRLTLGYAALFTLSALALFGLTYGLLMGYMQEQDEAFVATSVRVYAEAYARGGVEEVSRMAATLRADDLGEETLVRLSNARNETVLLLPPEDWQVADFVALEAAPPGGEADPDIENRREGQHLSVTTHRLPDGYILQVGISSDERDDVGETFPDVFLALSLPLLVLAFVGGAFMAHRALRPIRHLVHTFRAIALTGDVRERAAVPAASGEMAELFVLFNRMLDRIEALVAGMRQTLDNVAHDLRTPITRLRGTAEVALGEDRAAETYREALIDVLEASEGLTTTLDTMMDVAEAEAGAMPLYCETVRLAELAADVASLYELVADDRGVALVVDVEADAAAYVDRSRMRRALANLVDNAVKYTPAGGQVWIAGRTAGATVELEVGDSGPGLAPRDLPRIWDRLYRGDASRSARGLGLGLSLVRAIVEAHGGHVHAENRPEGGARFVVRLSKP